MAAGPSLELMEEEQEGNLQLEGEDLSGLQSLVLKHCKHLGIMRNAVFQCLFPDPQKQEL